MRKAQDISREIENIKGDLADIGELMIALSSATLDVDNGKPIKPDLCAGAFGVHMMGVGKAPRATLSFAKQVLGAKLGYGYGINGSGKAVIFRDGKPVFEVFMSDRPIAALALALIKWKKDGLTHKKDALLAGLTQAQAEYDEAEARAIAEANRRNMNRVIAAWSVAIILTGALVAGFVVGGHR